MDEKISSGCYTPLPNEKITCPEPSGWATCRPWDLESDAVNCLSNDLVDESLSIGGVTVNVHRLLGVHEQTKLIDPLGNGRAISSGAQQLFPASAAFTTKREEWRSYQGGGDLKRVGFLGYDFGEVRMSTGRIKYGVEANVRYNISTIKIKQGSKASNRVSRARVERSDDGHKWYGVEIINLPDDDKLNTISFKSSVPSRYWRLRPITTSGNDCDWWTVQALEMYEHDVTRLDNIQDKIWMENRNRDYDSAIPLKMVYDPSFGDQDLTRFGLGNSNQEYVLKTSFRLCVEALGRPIVIGDILELPNEAMFTPTLQRQKFFLEVTKVTWDVSGTITPGWQYTMLSITGRPAMASEETEDIFGRLDSVPQESGLMSVPDQAVDLKSYQDVMPISQYIHNQAKTEVPERGLSDNTTIRAFSEEEIKKATSLRMGNIEKVGVKRKGMYVGDATPPNGEEYTEGPELPDASAINATNNTWHRLTYEGSARDIPARLYRFSTERGRWVFIGSDKRFEMNNQDVLLSEYLTSPTSIPAREIKDEFIP